MNVDALRVLFLAHSYPRTIGDAAGSFLWHLAVALKKENVAVQVVAPSAPGLPARDDFEGIPVHRFRYAPAGWETLAYTGNMAGDVARSWRARFALLGFLAGQARLARHVRAQFAPHVVHAHWWFPAGLVGAAALASRQTPLLTTMHGSDIRLAGQTRTAHPLFRYTMRKSALATTVSRWLAEEARAMAPGTTVEVAPMPVAAELFSPGTARVAGQLLFVGRLNAQKGIAQLLLATAALSTPNVTLHVVGDGPDREALVASAAQLGLGRRITWHGALPHDRLPGLYRDAQLVVVPSQGEGLGLVAVEALLSETPVVAYDSGGLRDTIEHGVTGFLVPPGDVTALAAAIDHALGDQQRLAAMGRVGREGALARYAPSAVAARYALLYRRLVSR